MNSTIKKSLAIISTLSVWGLQHASAQVTAVDIGTGLPPATLGGYTMSPFDPGSIAGQAYYSHETAGNYDGGGTGVWETWGQSYTGNVYVASGSPTLTLVLSGQAEAVDFYEEPNQFEDFTMTATDSSGASTSTIINGDHGSSGVGFYEDVAGGPYLTEITVTCSDPTGFAIGEFGLAGGSLTGTTGTVPDTASSLLLLAMSVGGLVALPRLTRVFNA